MLSFFGKYTINLCVDYMKGAAGLLHASGGPSRLDKKESTPQGTQVLGGHRNTATPLPAIGGTDSNYMALIGHT